MPVVVLISGRGNNLQALIDTVAKNTLPINIRAVISNRPEAYGLERAKNANINTIVFEHSAYTSRERFDAALRDEIDRYQPGLVILAGFMRLLTPEFINHYMGRILNIHPSLLPAYRGLKTHQRALTDGAKEHGASVHFVIPELDSGPVVLQGSVPVLGNDTAETLGHRVLTEECRIYPIAIKWFAEGQLTLRDNHAYLDGTRLTTPCQHKLHEVTEA